ncbi:hypothetical protein EVAR_22336_1 [Eumeta japonica]|uniref:Uncharacterized protein n=1 Tax=Eumeta variegata TaxID=151549 RepID=A0A4C1VHX2_EUMVA|nr:hypothetical protein EVAR_22336_1 [Eumeta japonica]
MGRRNAVVRTLWGAARRFRAAQESLGVRWWGESGLAAAPLWALDTFVLLLKLCSSCTMAVVRTLFPPAIKSLYGETVLVTRARRTASADWWITPGTAGMRPRDLFTTSRNYRESVGKSANCSQVTGAGHGLGRELAVQFAELGASVVCWDSSACATDALVKHIRSKDGECEGYTVDIRVRDQVTSCALRLRRQLTDISILVVGVGAEQGAPIGSLAQLTAEATTAIVEINLLAHLWTIQAFLPAMIERRRGHIVAINSSAGLVPAADMVPQCAAHYGLRGTVSGNEMAVPVSQSGTGTGSQSRASPRSKFRMGPELKFDCDTGIRFRSFTKMGIESLMESITEELRLDTYTTEINTTCVYLPITTVQPTHRFASWLSEITPKEMARIIIEGMKKLCSRLSPQNLTETQKTDRVTWCNAMLTIFKEGASNLVWVLVTRDATWIYCCNPKTKQLSTVWAYRNESKLIKVAHE